jgi:hypothetical protein
MSSRQKISFACRIQPVPSQEKNKYVALASMEQLRKFLPNVDVEKNYDILPVAFQGFNVNLFNKNDDGIDSAGAVASYKTFIGKPINREHDRPNTVGYIVSATLTELNSNKEITEEEALATKKPFNVTFGGVLWRLVDENITEKVEESQDPDSPFYGDIFASFELGFDEREVIGIKNGRNLEDGVVLDSSEYAPKLKCLGGVGAADGYKLFNLVKGNLLGLGAALTTNPAAFVEPVATIPEKNEEEKSKEIEAQKQKSVKERKSMKISKIEDLTDEAMKEIAASSVREFLSDKVKEFATQYATEKETKEKELLAEKKAKEDLATEVENLKVQAKEAKESLDKLQAEVSAKENQEKLNARMTNLEETYDLSEDDIKILTKKVAGMNDEAYTAFASELEVLLKEKNRKHKESLKASLPNSGVTGTGQGVGPVGVSTSVVTASAAIDSAIDNATQVNTNIPNVGAPQETLLDKMKKAFGGENIKLTIR